MDHLPDRAGVLCKLHPSAGRKHRQPPGAGPGGRGGRPAIDDYHLGELLTDDKAFSNGHYYSDKAIGASLLGILVYWPLHLFTGPLPHQPFIMIVTTLAVSLPCALLAPLLFSMARKAGRGRWLSLTIALGIALGTPIFPYAGSFYGHSLAAVLVFGFFFLWLDVNQFHAPVTRLRFFLGGCLAGAMLLMEYPTALIVLPLMIYMVFVFRERTRTWDWVGYLLFAAGAFLFFSPQFAYNCLCFGSPLTIGYEREITPAFVQIHNTGLLGIGLPNLRVLLYMTIHPMQGILLQAPILLIALIGFACLWRRKQWRAEFFLSASSILIFFLAMSGAVNWWGGDALSVRYLIPVLPMFTVPLLFIPDKFRWPVPAVALLSFLQMLIASATPYYFMDGMIRETLLAGFRFSWDTSLLYRTAIPRLLRNCLTYSWGNVLLGLDAWYFNLALPVILALGLLIAFYAAGRRHAASPAQ